MGRMERGAALQRLGTTPESQRAPLSGRLRLCKGMTQQDYPRYIMARLLNLEGKGHAER